MPPLFLMGATLLFSSSCVIYTVYSAVLMAFEANCLQELENEDLSFADDLKGSFERTKVNILPSQQERNLVKGT